ncbi:hypothetical protein BDN70DRAFT_902036 [Pholiota conissans]|uniref:Uncharacterized protein n=1 Tax=Pholiota conissans TaxID=109636 RepID=A0A9P5YJN5_9AGAR|nr:hypothetical protein BDN70DRAFT_902036 [Pholiota conissans]
MNEEVGLNSGSNSRVPAEGPDRSRAGAVKSKLNKDNMVSMRSNPEEWEHQQNHIPMHPKLRRTSRRENDNSVSACSLIQEGRTWYAVGVEEREKKQSCKRRWPEEKTDGEDHREVGGLEEHRTMRASDEQYEGRSTTYHSISKYMKTYTNPRCHCLEAFRMGDNSIYAVRSVGSGLQDAVAQRQMGEIVEELTECLALRGDNKSEHLLPQRIIHKMTERKMILNHIPNRQARSGYIVLVERTEKSSAPRREHSRSVPYPLDEAVGPLRKLEVEILRLALMVAFEREESKYGVVMVIVVIEMFSTSWKLISSFYTSILFYTSPEVQILRKYETQSEFSHLFPNGLYFLHIFIPYSFTSLRKLYKSLRVWTHKSYFLPMLLNKQNISISHVTVSPFSAQVPRNAEILNVVAMREGIMRDENESKISAWFKPRSGMCSLARLAQM